MLSPGNLLKEPICHFYSKIKREYQYQLIRLTFYYIPLKSIMYITHISFKNILMTCLEIKMKNFWSIERSFLMIRNLKTGSNL